MKKDVRVYIDDVLECIDKVEEYTETMKLFLKQNNLKLDTPISGLVYISLKIANNEISYPELIEWIYRRLEDGNV